MAAERIGQVVATFSDAAGKQQISKHNVAITVTGGVLDVAAINAASGAIVDAMEAISKLKYESAKMTLDLSVDTTGYKANPVAGSAIQEEAWITFLSAVGDSQKRTQAKVWLPSPANTVLSSGGKYLDKTVTAVSDIITAVKTNALSLDGRDLITDAETGVRQRVSRK